MICARVHINPYASDYMDKYRNSTVVIIDHIKLALLTPAVLEGLMEESYNGPLCLPGSRPNNCGNLG